ncbi:MAG: hypothetical protein ACRD03_11630 [Acidimicrobiales bacterium]
MTARYFVDENDLGLGRALGVRHEGVVYPGHADLPDVTRGTVDDDWLRVVGDLRLVVITRDRRIRYRPVERAMWVAHRVRGFVLTGTASQSTADSLGLIDRHWMELEQLVASEPHGPWMRSLTKTGLRTIDLG